MKWRWLPSLLSLSVMLLAPVRAFLASLCCAFPCCWTLRPRPPTVTCVIIEEEEPAGLTLDIRPEDHRLFIHGSGFSAPSWCSRWSGDSIRVSVSQAHYATDCVMLSRHSDSLLSCELPPALSAGPACFTVVNPDGQSASLQVTLRLLCSLTSVTPTSGPAAGGTLLTLEGENFAEDACVAIGGVTCSRVVVVSPSCILCNSPLNHAGHLNVAVTQAGHSAVLQAAFHSYLDSTAALQQEQQRRAASSAAPLELLMVEPSSGPARGGTELELTVRGLQPGAVSVSIGGVAALNAFQILAESIICCATAATCAAGPVDVVVTNAGRSHTLQRAFTVTAQQPFSPPAAVSAPTLQVIMAEPDSGPSVGGTAVTLTVAGLQAGLPTVVIIGGVACEVILVDEAESSILCRTEPRAAGSADIVVHHGMARHLLPRGFRYTNQVAQSQPAASSLQAAPAPTFRPFAGSEAEALYAARQRRLRGGEWLSQVTIRGQVVSIHNSDIPRSEVEAYVILSPSLAKRAGVAVGDSLSQADLLRSPAACELTVALADPSSVLVVSGAMNPAYHQRSVSAHEQAFISHLRQQLRARIQARDRRASTGWHVNSTSLDGSLWVNADQTSGQHAYDSQELTAVLEATRRNETAGFTNALLNLSCQFSARRAEAKAGLIDAFTFLFVTKEFPSEGLRQKYLHFILQCGHIL